MTELYHVLETQPTIVDHTFFSSLAFLQSFIFPDENAV